MTVSAIPEGKSLGEKRYGWGRESGQAQVAAALRPASGDPRFPARAATTGFANRLATAGTNHAVRTSLESRGVFANVGYPAKSSSPPKPERATFSPTFLAAQETK